METTADRRFTARKHRNTPLELPFRGREICAVAPREAAHAMGRFSMRYSARQASRMTGLKMLFSIR